MFDREIAIKGKHATYMKFLSATAEANHKIKGAGVFERNIDVYMTSVVIGLHFGRREDVDNSIDDSTKIFTDAQSKENSNLKFLYRLVMLVDNSQESKKSVGQKITIEEKIDRAFRDLKSKENMELFNSYMRGGVSYLYEHFSSDATTKEDYLEKVKELVSTFNDEFEALSI